MFSAKSYGQICIRGNLLIKILCKRGCYAIGNHSLFTAVYGAKGRVMMLLLQLFAVDIGIDNLGFLFQRNDVIVGNGGRNEAGIAFAEGDFVARCAYFYFTIAFNAE